MSLQNQISQFNMIVTLWLRPLPHSAAGNYTKLIMLILCKSLVLISLPAQGRCTCLSQKPWRSEEGRSWRRRSGQCWARVPRASKNSFTKVRKHVCKTTDPFSWNPWRSHVSFACWLLASFFLLLVSCHLKLPAHMAAIFQRISVLCFVDVWLVPSHTKTPAHLLVSPVNKAANQIS